jgi:CBS domain-containing protein
MSSNLKKELLCTTYSKLELPALKIIPPTMTVSSVMAMFKTHQHLGIVSHSNPNTVIAIISLLDLARYIIPKIKDQKEFLQDPIEWILTLSPGDESYILWSADINDKIEDAMRSFASGLHHGMVYEMKNHFLLTQREILNHVLALKTWKTLLSKSINEFFPLKKLNEPKDLIQIAPCTLEEAFMKLKESSLPAMPIVENQKLINVLENSDILDIDLMQAKNQFEMKALEFLKVF